MGGTVESRDTPMKMKATPLSWLGFVTGVLVIVSAWDGLQHFPDPCPCTGNPTTWEDLIEYLWPARPFPITAPIMLMPITTGLVAWRARRSARKSSAVAATLTALALVTVFVPFSFIKHSLTGTGWIDTPPWYWTWLMALGTVCMVWFGTQIASARGPRLT